MKKFEAGQRYKITIDLIAVKEDSYEDWFFKAVCDEHEIGAQFFIRKSALDSAQIERIEAPLAVGDRVTWGTGADTYELVAIRGENAIVYMDDRYTLASALKLSSLRRVAP